MSNGTVYRYSDDPADIFNYVTPEDLEKSWDSLSTSEKTMWHDYDSWKAARKLEFKNKYEMGKLDMANVNPLPVLSPQNSYQQREEEIRRKRAERIRMLQEWRKKALEPQEEDKSNWVTDFAGNLTLGTASAASYGLLDVTALTDSGKTFRSAVALGAYRPWEEQTAAGKVGYIAGQGIGMAMSFGWLAKGLGLVGKAATRSSTNVVSKHIARKAGKEAVEKFGKEKGIEQLTKYGAKLMGGQIDDLAVEGLERGTLEVMREATKIIRSPGYKRLWKHNQEAYTKAVNDLSGHLLKEMPDMGLESALKMSDNLISSGMKYSTHQFHNYLDGVVGVMAQAGGRYLPGVAGKASQWTLTGKTGQLTSALVSDFVLGSTHKAAEAILQNIFHKGGQLVGTKFDEKELKQFENLNSSFVDLLGKVYDSGFWMSFIAPTRFIKGGRAGAKLYPEALSGLKTLQKAWKPAGRMSAKEARATLEYIDDVSEGALKSRILSGELKNRSIADLTKEEAVLMLKKVRKSFSGEWLNYMGKEIRQDLTRSAPRMIAGAMAMNLHAMKDYYDRTGKFDPVGAMGADPTEIVSNLIVGMVMAKSGRTFGDGKITNKMFRMFETGELKQYYTANVKKIKAVRHGLEVLGHDFRGQALDINSAAVEYKGRYLINTGEYKIVDDILKTYFVNAADAPIRKDTYALDKAYEMEVGPDGMANPRIAGKLRTALKVIGHYDNNGTDIGRIIRDVYPGEAKDIVDRINNIPGVKENSTSPTVWLTKVELQAANVARERFLDLQRGNIRKFYETLGIETHYDPITKRMTLPEVNLNKLFGARPSETLSDFKETHAKFLEENRADVKIEGRLPVEKETLKASQLKIIEKDYDSYRGLLHVDTYGKDTPIYDPGLMHNKNMWIASNVTKADLDYNNMFHLLTDVKSNQLYTSLSESDIGSLKDKISSLQLNRSLIPEVGTDHNISVERMAELTKFHARIGRLYNILTGNKNLNEYNNKPITYETIGIARDEFYNKIGDVLENDAVFQRMLTQAGRHMMNTMDIQSQGREWNLKQGLLVLMNGEVAPSGTTIGEIKKYGGLVKRRAERIDIPDANTLFELLKLSGEFEAGALESLRTYYVDFQDGMEAARSPVNIEKNTTVINDLINDVGGPINARNIIRTAKIFSDVGHIQDLQNGYTHIESFMDKISSDKEKYVEDYAQMDDYNVAITKNLENLIDQMGMIRSNIKHLIDTHDYEALLSIKLSESADFLETVRRFQGRDLSKIVDNRGNIIDATYEQALVDILSNARKIYQSRSLNIENISSYVDQQIRENPYEVPAREHALRMNTTPSKFEADYGIRVLDQELIIDNALGGKTADRLVGNQELLNAVETMYNTAIKPITQRFIDTGKVPKDPVTLSEKIYNDSWQLVATKAFMVEVKRVKYIGGSQGGMLQSDKTGYPLLDVGDSRGILGLKRLLFEDADGMYELQKGLKFKKEGEDVPRDLILLDKEILSLIDAQLEGGIGIEPKTIRNEFLKQTLKNSLEEEVYPAKVPMIRVVLDEGTQLAVAKDLAVKSVRKAYADGGTLYEHIRTLFGGDVTKANEYAEKYRTNNLSIKDLKDGINDAYNILNMPFTVMSGDNVRAFDRMMNLDFLKRRKLAAFTKGRILTSRYHSALLDFYKMVNANTNSNLSRILVERYEALRDPDTDRLLPFKGISIDDSGEAMSVIARFKVGLDKYDSDILAGLDRSQLEESVSRDSKEAVDSPTFLTKDGFLTYLGMLAPSSDLIRFNDAGEIIGFNIGAMKPKGVDIQRLRDGSVRVSYDKTAFFFNPKIGKALEAAGLVEIKLKSGNKINVERTAQEDLRDLYVDPIIRKAGREAESLEDIIIWTIEGSKDGLGVVERPWSMYDITQASMPHLGTVGSNTGVHYSDKSGLNDWTQTQSNLTFFSDLMIKMRTSPEVMTGVGREMSELSRNEGDLNPARTALDSFLDNNGIVVSDWMGDMLVDNLFSRVFQGGKIAKKEVEGSSHGPMSPMLNDKNVDVPVRYESKDGNGRQRIYGSAVINESLASMPFKYLGKTTTSDSNPNVTGFFISRHKFFNPFAVKEGKDSAGKVVKIKLQSKSDFVIIPGEKGKISIIVEGMELRKNGTLKDDLSGTVFTENKEFNKKVYENIKNEMDGLVKFIDDNNPTNERVLDRLAETDNMWMGEGNIRQPRNSFDIIINKIHREPLHKIGEVEQWQHYDPNEGNSTKQNVVDVIKQDADHDYDTSNSYLTTSAPLLKEVAKMAGSNVFNDPMEYSNLVLKKLEANIRDQESIKEWFLNVNNTGALRGRFVKLHQISTYLMNVLGEGGTLGKLTIDNQVIDIKMKSRSNYVKVVSDIERMVKYFLDNYKDIVDVRMDKNGFAPGIDQFIRHILFGYETKQAGKPVERMEGLFEFKGVKQKTQVDESFLSEKVGGEQLSILLYDKIVRPLNKYLSYNRGELSEQDMKFKMTLKDAAFGHRDVLNAYQLADMKAGMDAPHKMGFGQVDLTAGKKSLYAFLADGSKNPFDMGMMSLSGAYDSALALGRKSNLRETKMEELIFKAENKLLNEGDTNVKPLSDQLNAMVKDEGQLARLAIVSDKLASLEGELQRLNANQYSNPYDIQKMEQRVKFYANLKTEIEFYQGSKIALDRLENVFRFEAGRKVGSFIATGADMVVWDSQGKKIKQVIREGDANTQDINKSDMIVSGGKSFELAPAKRQARLREKWAAYGKPMLEMVDQTGQVKSMSRYDYDGTIIPAYMAFSSQYGVVGSNWKNHRDGQLLSDQRKGVIHMFLNELGSIYGLNDPLKRRAFLFKLMTPEIDQNTFVIKESNGKYAIDFRFTENEKISKTIYGYLTDVKEKVSFSKENVMSSIEADQLIKELANTHALAHYGLSNPYVSVDMAFTRTEGYLSNVSKRLVDIDRNVLKPTNVVKAQEHETSNALTMINQFINGDRLITPFDMARIARKIAGSNLFTTGESGSSNPVVVRKHGVVGSEPKETVSELFNKIKDRKKSVIEGKCEKKGL